MIPINSLEQVILGSGMLNQVKSRSLVQLMQISAGKLRIWLPGHPRNEKLQAR